ncbi:MAG: hypothetical protein E7Z76_06345 [Methanobrevibacter sp.]|nr:hypothetical protein [Methanobrevibacter sp.]
MKKIELRNDFEVTDDVFDEIVSDFDSGCDEWFQNNKQFVDEFVAFYIASGIKHNALWRGSLTGLINGAVETLAGYVVEESVDKNSLNKLLLEKYHLKLTNENPMQFEELD